MLTREDVIQENDEAGKRLAASEQRAVAQVLAARDLETMEERFTKAAEFYHRPS